MSHSWTGLLPVVVTGSSLTFNTRIINLLKLAIRNPSLVISDVACCLPVILSPGRSQAAYNWQKMIFIAESFFL
jgi:hypothetical protein